MKIGLIGMSGVRIHSPQMLELGVTLPGFVKRGEVIAQLPSLGILTVAGLTPKEHDVFYLEIETANNLNSLPSFDLVGISSLTAKINEAYKIASHYRSQGTIVVMGGLHVSVMPEEALNYADIVVVNGAEKAWPQLLEDIKKGQPQRLYYGETSNVFDDEIYALPRFEFLEGKKYNRVTVQTSRGCPRDCDFCAASLLISKGFNQKPIDKVIYEIEAAKKYFKQPFFEFADDNTFLNKNWSKDFLKKLQKQEIRYFTETDISVIDDTELCDLIAASGCRQLLIGFESPFATDLDNIDPRNWKKKQSSRIKNAVDILQSRGIGVIGCFILGMDNHTPDIFPLLFDFVKSSGIEDVQYTILTPFPGTPLYQKLHNENRLIQDIFWDSCTLFDINFHPKNMTIKELEEGVKWLFTETYCEQQTNARKNNFHKIKNAKHF